MALKVVRLPDDADAIQAMIWLRTITKAIGPGFHPDTSAAEYVEGSTNQPLFSVNAAVEFDADLESAYNLLVSANRDPYAIGGRVQRRMMGFKLTA